MTGGKSMKVYKIKDAYIKNQHVDIEKTFASRVEAINYMFDYYNDHFIYNVELEDEYMQGNKHNIHYVISQDNSFNVVRLAR